VAVSGPYVNGKIDGSGRRDGLDCWWRDKELRGAKRNKLEASGERSYRRLVIVQAPFFLLKVK
jgi:hypothetical protein